MNFWTDERIETLTKMWKDGKSASQIAYEVRATRNAVIGKVHRLGLSRDAETVRQTRVILNRANVRSQIARMKKAAKPKAPITGKRTFDMNRAADAKLKLIGGWSIDDINAAPPRQEFNARAFAPIPGHEPVPFMSKGCKWPVEGSGADMLCCGREKDGERPYCADHAKVAFVPFTPEQKRLAKYVERIARRAA